MSMDVYRLSPQQQRVWRLQRRDEPLRVECLMRLEGEARRNALNRALEHLVERHEVLRTLFPAVPGQSEPAQAVAPRGEVEWAPVDLRTLGPEERERHARAHFEQVCARPFALDSGPVLRVTLATLDERLHLLGSSSRRCARTPPPCACSAAELQSAYVAPAGKPGPTSAPLPYLSFSEWQSELLAERADSSSPAATWWERRSRAAASVALPLERRQGAPLPPLPGAPRLHAARASMASLEGAAPSLRVHTGRACSPPGGLLIGKLSGQKEFVLGLRSDGREHPEAWQRPSARWRVGCRSTAT